MIKPKYLTGLKDHIMHNFFLLIDSIMKENIINLKLQKYVAVQNVMKGVYLASASF